MNNEKVAETERDGKVSLAFLRDFNISDKYKDTPIIPDEPTCDTIAEILNLLGESGYSIAYSIRILKWCEMAMLHGTSVGIDYTS